MAKYWPMKRQDMVERSIYKIVGGEEHVKGIAKRVAQVSVAGSGFGPTGEGHIRLSFGATERELEKAFDRIEEWGVQYTWKTEKNSLILMSEKGSGR